MLGVNVIWNEMKSLGIRSRRIVRRRRWKWHLMIRLLIIVLTISLTIALTIFLLPIAMLALGFLLLASFIKNTFVPIALSAVKLVTVEFGATVHVIFG